MCQNQNQAKHEPHKSDSDQPSRNASSKHWACFRGQMRRKKRKTKIHVPVRAGGVEGRHLLLHKRLWLAAAG